MLRAQDGGGDAAAGVSAVVERHRAALHRAMSAMQAVVMQVNEEVRKLEAQLLASSLVGPPFALQRDLAPVIKRETRVLLPV